MSRDLLFNFVSHPSQTFSIRAQENRDRLASGDVFFTGPERLIFWEIAEKAKVKSIDIITTSMEKDHNVFASATTYIKAIKHERKRNMNSLPAACVSHSLSNSSAQIQVLSLDIQCVCFSSFTLVRLRATILMKIRKICLCSLLLGK